MKAILLDRDGTINRERADYVRSTDQLELLPDVNRAFALLAEMGLPVAIVTNQAGIARGAFTWQTLDDIHTQVREYANEAGLKIADVIVCPHHPDEKCGCRKPQPGMIQQAAASLGVNVSECVLIGDSVADWEAANRAGCEVVLVRTGRQGEMLDQLLMGTDTGRSCLTISADLLEAVTFLQERMKKSQ